MTGYEAIYYAGLTVLGCLSCSFYAIIRTQCKCKEAGAYSGGQAFVSQEQAKSAERQARANAYFAQVQSMETAWQSYLENHYAVAGNGKPGSDDIRAMRAAFENMYSLEHLENL